MQRARARWSTDNVASAAIAILGATVAVTGTAFSLSVLGILMVVGGAAWITYISLFSALVQTLAPDWGSRTGRRNLPVGIPRRYCRRKRGVGGRWRTGRRSDRALDGWYQLHRHRFDQRLLPTARCGC